MQQADKMICPDCDVAMNHHAMKIEYGLDDQEIDAVFGGVLNEAHTCPECGKTELRAA